MSWSPWLRLADANYFYVEQTAWLPICFQLAGGPPDAADETLSASYVGAAENEHVLFEALEGRTHRLSPRIDEALAEGQHLYYRWQARPTLEAAEAHAAELRAAGDFPWSDEA